MTDKVKHNVAYGCCGNEGCVGGLPTGTWQVTRCQCEALKPIQIPILECVGVAHLSQHPCPSCGKNVDTYKPSTEWIANAAERDILTVVALMRTKPMDLLLLRNRSYQEIQDAISHLIDGQKLVLTAEQYLEIPAIERNVR